MENLKKVFKMVEMFFNRDWTFWEKVLMVADCILFGILLGAIWSPKREKSTAFGSFNSGNGCGNIADKKADADDENEE
ncbi:hypothetical protein [Hespellia stercorisuis]|uniref:Uncharacterized protein n=1 Tax=Hespellia stercorisuis DSM 15480 TaxID=1121950 RepID=A0A1M6JGM5_9FIRM|nr:hypothetical protein [Hespellia stercorisuis]SHJ45815.1 hypothetical protein SAMN02745243_00635 [Hespellia stercorisuis DSM 15480]